MVELQSEDGVSPWRAGGFDVTLPMLLGMLARDGPARDEDRDSLRAGLLDFASACCLSARELADAS